MKINEIKKEMLLYEDFYGGDLLNVSEVANAKTKKELAEIIEKHRRYLDDMRIDANSHLDDFKKKVGLTDL